MNEILVAGLLLLTGPDGHKVLLNPEQVVTLHSKKADKGDAKLFVPGAECLINTADGKYVAVIETCTVVKNMLERQHGNQ